MIEAALGERAQYIVISPGRRLQEYLAAYGKRISGRVGFLPLDSTGPAMSNVDLSDELGVVGRADRFVEAPLDLAPLVRRLLSGIWMVENLNHAISLADGPGRGFSFVTLAGEVLS